MCKKKKKGRLMSLLLHVFINCIGCSVCMTLNQPDKLDVGIWWSAFRFSPSFVSPLEV